MVCVGTDRSSSGRNTAVDRTTQDQLDALARDVFACTRCANAGHLPAAHPVIWGPIAGRNMVIGQAPAKDAHLSPGPWQGATGRLMRQWFARAGFDPDRFYDDWYFTSITKCFPGKAVSGNGDRAPSGKERALCRPYLDAELALVRPPLILTMGRLAAEAVIPGARSLSLKDLVGSVRTVELPHGAIPVVPLPHPSGVGRWLNHADNRALVDRAMDALAELRAVPA
jgi:uracil-DNA glycosylase